ncbi:MAG: hypothetical protein HN720_04665, partial [Nitrospinaceae bacterium]|nr:hypothetical protein [Nitrospinaceae bacterium]
MLSWLPENVSTFGGDVDSIFSLIYNIVSIWFVATQAILIFCIIRFRRRAGRRSDYLPGNTMSQMMWILIPCAVVLALDLWIDFR